MPGVPVDCNTCHAVLGIPVFPCMQYHFPCRSRNFCDAFHWIISMFLPNAPPDRIISNGFKSRPIVKNNLSAEKTTAFFLRLIENEPYTLVGSWLFQRPQWSSLMRSWRDNFCVISDVNFSLPRRGQNSILLPCRKSILSRFDPRTQDKSLKMWLRPAA